MAAELPSPTVTVSRGSSSPYGARASASTDSASMAVIRPLLSRPTRPSVTPRSARASMGLARDHSPSAFRSRTERSGPSISSESTSLRVMSRIDLSRRSKVVWSNVVSRKPEMRKTRFEPATVA